MEERMERTEKEEVDVEEKEESMDLAEVRGEK